MFYKGKNGSFFKETYKSGVKQGRAKIYYPDHQKFGRVKFFEGNYEKGLLHGEVKKYHLNGNVAEEYNVIEGNIEGIAKYYNKDNILI